MSDVTPAGQPGTAQQAAVAAALVVLERMGLSPADLVAALRCLYQRAAADGLIAEADNPACAGCASWPSTRSAALWVGTWVTLGYLAGSHIDTIYHYITLYSSYVLIALAVLLAAYIARRVLRRGRS